MIGASSRAATRSMPATARLQVGSVEEAGGFHAKAQSRKVENRTLLAEHHRATTVVRSLTRRQEEELLAKPNKEEFGEL
jgi:hypothetical protein